MSTITFEQIDKMGHIVFENELYKQVHFPEMLSRYDSNFMEFKQIPTLLEFKETEQILWTFHHTHGQKHVKFIFPPNDNIPDEITTYLVSENYTIGFLELYAIEPSHFSTRPNEKVNVELVTDDNLHHFLKLNYDEDVQYGQNFAKEKQSLLRRQFHEPNRHQIVAYYEGVPTGAVQVLEREETAEIDNLFVVEAFQRKGIGSQIQQFVMDMFKEKTVILVADGEDTARDMYQKQNYAYHGFQYEALKVEE